MGLSTEHCRDLVKDDHSIVYEWKKLPNLILREKMTFKSSILVVKEGSE